jgi:hypothetical protein
MYISIFRDKNMPPTEATNMSQDAKLFRRGGAEFGDYWEECKKRNRELVLARQKALQAAGDSRHIQEQGNIRTHFSSHKKSHIKPTPRL